MPKMRYKDFDFRPSTLRLIATCNEIIATYQAQGYDLTLRQLYYQLVSRAVIPNTEQSYKSVGSIMNDARLAGLIDWDAIVDRTRNLRSLSHWETPAGVIDSAAHSYRTDKWAQQSYRLECWIEKDALTGVIAGPCNELDVPYFSCRGYTSQSEMWGAAQRLLRYVALGQTPVLLHLGDHDPSGIDMSRDIEERLQMFMHGDGPEVVRLALNMDQVRQYNPPPNPAKLSDSRSAGYVDLFGDESWELDALEPTVIGALIRDAVLPWRDQDLWREATVSEERERAHLRMIAQRWETVVERMSDELPAVRFVDDETDDDETDDDEE